MERQLMLPGKVGIYVKIPKDQKGFFENASRSGGFRTLTDFIINAVREKAVTIIREQNTVLTSEKDREIFFDAVMNPTGPNEKLREVAERYELFIQSGYLIG